MAASKYAIQETLTLSTNIPVKIPRLGLGTYLSPPDRTRASCLAALEVGYRHIDTAQYYGNEAEVGQAIRQCGLAREDIFVTTKILKTGKSVDANYAACLESIERIGGGKEDGYVDLFLIHSTRGGPKKRADMWLALERLYEEGRVKAIGVSNFGIQHIEQLKGVGKVWPPHVDQFELHPWCQQREIVQYCEDHNIVVQAYCPIVRNKKADDETLVNIANKHKVSPNQVLLRWSFQKGWVLLPKSDNPDRIRLNSEIFTFELDQDDMAMLDGLDQGPQGALVFAVDNSARK